MEREIAPIIRPTLTTDEVRRSGRELYVRILLCHSLSKPIKYVEHHTRHDYDAGQYSEWPSVEKHFSQLRHDRLFCG